MKRKPTKADWMALWSEFGRLGGEARARALTPERRKEIAQKAGLARWKKAARRKAAA